MSKLWKTQKFKIKIIFPEKKLEMVKTRKDELFDGSMFISFKISFLNNYLKDTRRCALYLFSK